ncbi:hypothetical protein [Dickeya phage JA15]|nr:hypothetical protein [Dickeya phage JA15]ASD51547.1 hypothetical protein [Dickeya phage XF4]ATW62170.1 hypothetical protein [Dickeya phage PP35]AYN55545.1 hypothetical protein [Dickeya phage Coodle]AYN55749.1 hypothetical protein [Dickeya phage Kamild]QHB41673.1 hypothetical protein [Dickeya phage Ds5CZ]QHB41876.1 hypothetical protein [Dickeya phage Ds9CZ]QHB42079.1 hypothetical protein [Dickeya phage Ds16CZ]QHB42282.1 hypothetical protein [Dickeya phage Ds20CZ]QHB42477.1 hypothetical p
MKSFSDYLNECNDEPMVEFVEKRGDKWVVLDHTKTKVLGTHDTKAGADSQLKAIEANKYE